MNIDVGKELINVDGMFLERDVYDIIKRIKEYDENLEILYLDPARGPDINDAPYIIAERGSDGNLYRVFEVWTLDASVLERIRVADTHTNDILAFIDRGNEAVRRQQKLKAKEEMAESHDVAAALLSAPKTTFSFHNSKGELIHVDDQYGVIKRNGKSVS